MFTDFKEFELRGWEDAAPFYQNSWSSLTRKFIPFLLQAVNLKPGMKFLDLACGPGYVSQQAKLLNAVPTGVDFSSKMISIAKSLNPDITFYKQDVEKLDFDSGIFEAAAMNFGAPHLSDHLKAFSEAARVLKEGGRFAFTTWAEPDENSGSSLMRNALEKYGNPNVNVPEGPSYFLLEDKESCLKLLTKAGFKQTTFNYETITVEWEIPAPSFLFEAEYKGGVRTALVLKSQSEESLSLIKSDIEKEIKKFRNNDKYILPMTAHVISAEVQMT